MIWFFERDDQELRVETRYANDTDEYLLVIYWPDGEQCERFTDAAEFRSRLMQIEARLAVDRWAPNRSPVVVPEGLPRRS